MGSVPSIDIGRRQLRRPIPTFRVSDAAARPNTPTNNTEYTEASHRQCPSRLPRYAAHHDQERLGVTFGSRRSLGKARSPSTCPRGLQATRQADFLEAISFSRTAVQGGKPQASVVEVEYDPNGNLLYGVFNGVDIRSESRFDELDTFSGNIRSVGPGDYRQSALFLSAAARTRNSATFQTTRRSMRQRNGYTIDFRESRGSPLITYPFRPDQYSGSADRLARRGVTRRTSRHRRSASASRCRQPVHNFRGDMAWVSSRPVHPEERLFYAI